MQQSQILCAQKTSVSCGSNISRTTVLEMLIYGISAKPHCKESACNAGDLSLIPGSEDPLEKEIATHSSILAWGVPWTEKSWQATIYGMTGVRHHLAIKPSPPPT